MVESSVPVGDISGRGSESLIGMDNVASFDVGAFLFLLNIPMMRCDGFLYVKFAPK